MKKRFKLSPRKSRKMFSRNASRTHRFNMPPKGIPMRGGIRA